MSYTTSANFGSPRGSVKSLKSLSTQRCHGSVLDRTDSLTGRLTVGQFENRLFADVSCTSVCRGCARAGILNSEGSLPLAHTPDVHEITTTIVTDSSAMQAQDRRRAGERRHGSLSRRRQQSLDGSPLTANSRNLNRRPNALFQTTTNAAIAANTTTAVTPKPGLINCKALQAARMRARSPRIPPSVFTSNLPLLRQAHFVFVRLSRVAAAVPQPARGRIQSAHLVRHSLPK